MQMGLTGGQQRQQQHTRWCGQYEPLSPLLEDQFDPEVPEESQKIKETTSWDVIRECFRPRDKMNRYYSMNHHHPSTSSPHADPSKTRRRDMRLLLGVLGCPLAPVPLLTLPIINRIKDAPIETSRAHYIIHQYLAATGCLKREKKWSKNMYAMGGVKMACWETEVSKSRGIRKVWSTLGTRSGAGESGCFLLWQMSPGMWSLELLIGGNKVVAGSNGKIVWRHTPWLGTHVAKGPHRPLRRIIQGLDPKSTSRVFAKGQYVGDKRINGDDCFVLRVAADSADVMERSEGPAEVIRHVLHGCFSQRTGLLVHMEDSHLTRVQAPGNDTVYWETITESWIEDYRDVDGALIAHQGRTVATVFRFGGAAMQHSRTRMEEAWKVDDAVFNVPGLSIDNFIPPADILFDAVHSP